MERSSSYREAMAGVAGGAAGSSSNSSQLHGGSTRKKIDGSLTSTSFTIDGTDPLHQFCQEKEASPSGVCAALRCILVLLHGGVPPTKKKVKR
jgi:hypothetical protein